MPENPHQILPQASPVDVHGFLDRVEAQVRQARPADGARESRFTAAPSREPARSACACCGTEVAPSTLQRDPRLGLSCILCTHAVREVRRRIGIALQRTRDGYEQQLLQVVRDVRSGVAAYPTFDQPDF